MMMVKLVKIATNGRRHLLGHNWGTAVSRSRKRHKHILLGRLV